MPLPDVAPHHVPLLGLLALAPIVAYGLQFSGASAAFAALNVGIVAGLLMLAFGALEAAGAGHGELGTAE